MLTLGRRFYESVVIRHAGETLLVQLIPRRSDDGANVDVRVGFEGPRTFEIVREELLPRTCKTLGCPQPAELDDYCAECWERGSDRVMKNHIEAKKT